MAFPHPGTGPSPASSRALRNRLSLAILAGLLCVPAAQAQSPAAARDVEAEKAVDLGAVTVTARKRDERQIDVPIAITAVTGEQIDAMGLRNVVDVINITPGASSIDTGGAFTQVQIRGVSSSLGGNDNGYYVDETPFTGVTVPWYPDTRSFDIDRVEILKGPQGTLFGEGSMGGTVRILTRKPEFNHFGAGVELDASSVKGGGDAHGAKAYVNVPLLDDRLALRMAVTDERTPGWIDDSVSGRRNVNGSDVRTWRAKLRFAPTDNWNIDLAYWKYRSDSRAAGNNAYDDMTNASFLASDNQWDSASLTSTWELDGSQVVYTFSDGDLSYPQNGDLSPGVPLAASIDIGVRTHELRWASTGEHTLDWTVGYYLRKADRADVLSIPGIMESDSRQTNDAHAVFGEATLKLPNPAWSVTAGLRYFRDKVDAADIAADGSTSSLKATFDSWNPRLSVSYKPSDDTTLYASAARGFRSGQLQPIGSIQLAQQYGVDLPSQIAADSIWTYELGAKSILADGKLLVEGALFYSDWKDVAVRVPITPEINGLVNSDGTRNKGVELSVAYTPVRDLTLQLAASYVDATYSDDVVGTPLNKGTPVYNVPSTSINAGVSYGWDVGSQLRGVASANLHHDSARKTALTAGSPGDAITLAGVRVGLESPAGWGAYLYGSNLTNEDGAINARGATEYASDGSFLRYGPSNRPQPRTFGVMFRYDY
ncbi:TonB-dependent receptor [Stenotrophomonas mori]|uniref:TonB-dependent receptor n=1 Tax=Stenotrophomonas mori TaxID=2871096 RepID=A0ABT0SJL5_9GAMM|nr:TonB-dependent receptor [Stenotrophomonas mori]MCL7715533.1 TonB-dependent receptor [Stenotrophomonas mori]